MLCYLIGKTKMVVAAERDLGISTASLLLAAQHRM